MPHPEAQARSILQREGQYVSLVASLRLAAIGFGIVDSAEVDDRLRRFHGFVVESVSIGGSVRDRWGLVDGIVPGY